MNSGTGEIVILVLGTIAAFAIPYSQDLGLWWSIGFAALFIVIAVAVRRSKSQRSS